MDRNDLSAVDKEREFKVVRVSRTAAERGIRFSSLLQTP